MKLRPCSENGESVSFETLMEIERINDSTYRSLTHAFQPGSPFREPGLEERGRTYGGHVYAQAVWAASHTVGKGFVVNSVTGFFLLLGDVSLPFVYSVKTLRDGKNFSVRSVDVTQEETRGSCFTCICSFKRPDPSPVELQDRINIEEHYAVVLAGKKPQDHRHALSVEVPVFRNSPEIRSMADPFPGLITTKVTMKQYNAPRSPIERRQLTYYRTIGTLPSVKVVPNLHACAHLYASDRNSLFIIPRFWDIDDNFRAMASLNHTVIFHGGAEMLDMSREEECDRWYVQEARTDRHGDGRGTHHSRLIDSKGVHVASSLQDGMVRLDFFDEHDLETLKQMHGPRNIKL